jgi:hypothetical protein
LNEVDEARRVCLELAEQLKLFGVDVAGPFFDDTSTTQSQNLSAITNWHNAQTRELDISVHFNASDGQGHGTECLYVTQERLAEEIAGAIAAAGHVTNRGAKYRSDLAFLNNTTEPAVLIEVVFVDNQGDVRAYHTHFDAICEAIAQTVWASFEKPEATVMHVKGTCSWFGGPTDYGVSASEGLALEAEGVNPEQKPHLFLAEQPAGTTGNARRLNDQQMYIACRWDYDVHPKERLAGHEMALVKSPKTGKHVLCHPVDWGPHEEKTGRVADLSPGAMDELGIETDDEVEVIYPAPHHRKAK